MQAGEQVGKYILERKLGEGGMAQVWQARHIDLGKLVAIKCLSTRFTTNAEFEQRFLSEGRRQAALRHPNIVEVVDFLAIGDDRFLIMEYIEGQSVTALQKRVGGPLPLEVVDSISQDITMALDHAHKRGLVHRDVKPSNIMLDETGKAYLTDFGIAVAVGEDRLTRTGMAVGTVHYMSPEQIARPREIDHRTDVYSFGCVLYEMLTGRPPFISAEGDTEFTIMNGHLTQAPPPLQSLNPAVPASLEPVVQKCLAKDPAARFATCEELGRALRRVFHPEATTGQMWAPQGPVTAQQPTSAALPTNPPSAPQPANRLMIYAIIAAVVVLGGAAAAYFALRPAPEPAPVVQDQPPPAPPPAAVQPPPAQPAESVQLPEPATVPPPAPVTAPVKPAVKKAAKAAAPAPEAVDPGLLERRIKACLALGLSEAQCEERLKKSP